MKVNDRVTVKRMAVRVVLAWYWQLRSLVKHNVPGFAGRLPARHLVL